MKKTAIFMMGLVAASAACAQDSKVESVPFEKCKSAIQVTAKNTGITPVTVADTTDENTVRFVASDGSVLVKCSRADNTMTSTAE